MNSNSNHNPNQTPPVRRVTRAIPPEAANQTAAPNTAGQTYTQPGQTAQSYAQPNAAQQTYVRSNTAGQTYAQPNAAQQTYVRPNTAGQTYAQPNQTTQTYAQQNAAQQTYVRQNAAGQTRVQSGTSGQQTARPVSHTPTPVTTRTASASAQTARPRTASSGTAAPRRTNTSVNVPTRSSTGKKLTASQRHQLARGKSMKKVESGVKDNTFSGIIKAMIYIIFVLVVSGFLSYYIIVVGNDVFAFVKDDSEVTIDLPEGATTAELAELLYQKKVIRYPNIFTLYASFRHYSDEYESGSFTVNASTNYDDLITVFKPAAEVREQISITIREGLTINEMIDIFVEKGIGTREGYIDVIQNYEFDYWFLDETVTGNKNRAYRLEGYLYPDTYYFYTDSSEVTVIKKFLDRFDEVFDERYKESCEAVGMTVDDVIILASMIQMEAKYVSEYGAISSVFHNRLNNPYYETYGFLNSDATIQYALNERKSELTSEDTELDSLYNTYKYKGLPPGPICNPSLDAINYAMYPDDTDYYYFVSRKNGYSFFATNAEDHEKNIIAARAGE